MSWLLGNSIYDRCSFTQDMWRITNYQMGAGDRRTREHKLYLYLREYFEKSDPQEGMEDEVIFYYLGWVFL